MATFNVNKTDGQYIGTAAGDGPRMALANWYENISHQPVDRSEVDVKATQNDSFQITYKGEIYILNPTPNI